VGKTKQNSKKPSEGRWSLMNSVAKESWKEMGTPKIKKDANRLMTATMAQP